MSFQYRLIVVAPPFSATKGTINMTDPLFSVDSYDVAPDGNCLEATFRLPPKSLSFTIELRDVITIETRPNSTASWVPRYVGYVALAGNTRSDNVETYRLVGLKQRFYERVLGNNVVSTGAAGALIRTNDVATMATKVFETALQNGGIEGVANPFITLPDAPLTSFTLGDRYTQLETAGSALDALAAATGAFVVPSAQTYTYDGETFNANDIVPPVTWGVRADGSTFFRRTLLNAKSFNESDLDVDVTWPALSGEEVVSRPILVYYPGMDLSRVSELVVRNASTSVNTDVRPVFQPWVFLDSVNNPSDLVVQLPEPSALLLDATSTFGTPTSNFSSPTNIYDSNPATAGTGTLNQFFEISKTSVALSAANYGLRIRAEFGDTIAIRFRGEYSYTVGGVNFTYRWIYVPEATAETGETTLLDVTFPSLIPVDVYQQMNDAGAIFGLITFTATVIAGPNGSGGTVQLFDCRPFASTLPTDSTFARRLSDSYKRLAPDSVTNVKVYGEAPIGSRVDVTPLVGSVLEVPVERVQYSITTAEGITTTYHAGQAFDGELVSERVVLEGLARRAVRS